MILGECFPFHLRICKELKKQCLNRIMVPEKHSEATILNVKAKTRGRTRNCVKLPKEPEQVKGFSSQLLIS